MVLKTLSLLQIDAILFEALRSTNNAASTGNYGRRNVRPLECGEFEGETRLIFRLYK